MAGYQTTRMVLSTFLGAVLTKYKTSLTECSSALGYVWRQPYLSLKSHEMSEKTQECFTTSRQNQSRTLPGFHR